MQKKNTKSAPRLPGAKRLKCYMHEVEDPNQTPFDITKHQVCIVCSVKLYELAKAEVEFSLRGSVVGLMLTPDEQELEQSSAE